MKITLKIFLHDTDVGQLHAAVDAALAKLSTNRVDTLFVATPTEILPHVAIGSGAVGDEQDEARQQLLGNKDKNNFLIQKHNKEMGCNISIDQNNTFEILQLKDRLLSYAMKGNGK